MLQMDKWDRGQMGHVILVPLKKRKIQIPLKVGTGLICPFQNLIFASKETSVLLIYALS